MDIIIGSKNPTKVKAVQSVFSTDQVQMLDVESEVSAQPFSDEETRRGAINRAQQCASSITHTIGIGLEGGVMYVNKELFLCNWGALVTAEGDTFTAGGARMKLPEAIGEQLHKGKELGEIIDSYAKKNAVRNQEGAIGIFTKDLISRQTMFQHIVLMLKGQLKYWK